MSRDVLESLRQYNVPITEALQTVLRDIAQEFPDNFSDQGKWAFRILTEYAARPAKRLRGALAAYTYDTFSGKTCSTQAVELGVVLELMQNYLLIIDDVMDESPLRRGFPTVQKLYRQQYPEASEHEANMVAINVGLLTQHMANMLLARIDEAPEHIQSVTTAIQRNIAITGVGQIDDLYQRVGLRISDDDIKRKYLLKSAYYTFINPIQAGLALAGVRADEEVIDYGGSAGTAFQLHDDYLGIFGNDKQTGKANLDDIQEGKYTYMVHYVLTHGTKSQKETLAGLIGNADADAADLLAVRDLLQQTGAVAANQELERTSVRAAKEAVAHSQLWSKAYADVLLALVDYVIRRDT